MNTINHPNSIALTTFMDNLSGEFIAQTGYGAYVYLNPVDIERLFQDYRQQNMPIRNLVRRLLKNL
ncbi:hypothetical protein ACQE3E_02335 [Methylomonas sp. MED-D]|uniref:hypothetical protein n=1 Tax=Methylomonas sp. MED-D TaxID=3418768 RepID=UPI001438B91D|nr:hypothetical protein [Methylococcaceae bacterium WWC4]